VKEKKSRWGLVSSWCGGCRGIFSFYLLPFHLFPSFNVDPAPAGIAGTGSGNGSGPDNLHLRRRRRHHALHRPQAGHRARGHHSAGGGRAGGDAGCAPARAGRFAGVDGFAIAPTGRWQYGWNLPRKTTWSANPSCRGSSCSTPLEERELVTIGPLDRYRRGPTV
jgi:hypothetical protein